MKIWFPFHPRDVSVSLRGCKCGVRLCNKNPYAWLPWHRSSRAICDPRASGGFGWLMTFDLAESLILSGRNIFCITAIKYNSYVSKDKITVAVSFINKIHQTLATYICGCWTIQSFLRKLVNLKNSICEKSTPNWPNSTRDILAGDCFMRSVGPLQPTKLLGRVGSKFNWPSEDQCRKSHWNGFCFHPKL